jgi:hypothetical protein
MEAEQKVRVVGNRRPPATPEEAFARAQVLQRQLELIHPFPRPRGFVFKAKTRAEYEAWRKAQKNPRLW